MRSSFERFFRLVGIGDSFGTHFCIKMRRPFTCCFTAWSLFFVFSFTDSTKGRLIDGHPTAGASQKVVALGGADELEAVAEEDGVTMGAPTTREGLGIGIMYAEHELLRSEFDFAAAKTSFCLTAGRAFSINFRGGTGTSFACTLVL